jgi:hypothetical protein
MSTKLAKLDLNFAPARRNAPMGWVLLGVGLIAATLAGVQFRSAHAERLMHAGDLTMLSAKLNPSRASDTASPNDSRAAKAAAGVARDLQVPWSELLSALESVQAKDVALLAVEPSPIRHNVRITAEAKNTDAMLSYIDALRGDSFPEVYLSSHQFEANTPGDPVRFVVQARWRSQ